MGAGGSVRRTAPSLQSEIDRLRKKELDLMEEVEKQHSVAVLKNEAEKIQLESEKHELAEQLKQTTMLLSTQKEGWDKEREKTLSLMFSDLPLTLLRNTDLESASLSGIETNSLMTRSFPMVTFAQCDIVGFSSLSARLSPQQVITIIDKLHAIIDKAFADGDIFIMERTSDGCIAASGLVEYIKEDESKRTDTFTPLSMSDSSYGSETNLGNEWSDKQQTAQTIKTEDDSSGIRKPSFYAGVISTAALKLMSSSAKISVSLLENSKLQLRVALHSGPCSAGVVGLQTSTGISRVPHYKVFGPALKYLKNLCSSGLALQIRVSKQCRDQLLEVGGYLFERCPDYVDWSNRKPIESYWLVAREDMPLKLPSVDEAISLQDYDDIEF